ncbi:MAG: 50S ribosomal protein L22 [Legionellales bacterium RIFCSPHIGHO2_12_FULL_37_14]|nr:MAG: 50S ribosomal protein L22 [Legionellales bacterium RIFCSPHIGHO2_12_FULL_37_14]
MEVSSTLNGAKLSAQKGRLIADMIRKKSAASALDILRFTPKKGAQLMLKLLESAMANAENNKGADIDELHIAKIEVNEGPTFKRMMPRAKGRMNRICKRTCHITITVAEQE